MNKWTLLATLLAAMAAGVGTAAFAADNRPSREQITAALNLRAGAQVPVVVGGRRYEAQYVRLEARRDGDYALIFRLRK